MRPETAAHFNELAREIEADPMALEKRFAADFKRLLGGPTFCPLSPEPLAPVASPDSAPAAVFSEESE
jgi:hypothetical protein